MRRTVPLILVPDGDRRLLRAEHGRQQRRAGYAGSAARESEGTRDAERLAGARIQLNAKNPTSPLYQKEVRQAINYAVDVDTLVKTVLEGHARRIATILPQAAFGYDPAVKPYAYNPEKAKQLLAAAGYPNGFDIILDSPSGVYLKDKDVVEAVAGMLTKVGIRVKVNFRDFNNMLNDLRVDKVNDMYFLSNLAWTQDAYNTLQSYAHTGRIYARHTNTAMDPWVDIEENSMDPAKRQEAFTRIQEILKDEAYYLFLYTGNEIYGISDKVDWEGPGSQIMHFNIAAKR
jgi:peptide/nickel transport system substrate-binding protein